MAEADAADINKIDPWLASQKFFHGFLSREDLPCLLQNHGDFLVRCNEADKTQPREIIVSVLCDPDGRCKTADQSGKLRATRNFVVQTAMSNKTRKYFFDSREKFESIEDLLTHHSETPLVVNQTEVLFKRAIRLGKWEFTPQQSHPSLSCYYKQPSNAGLWDSTRTSTAKETSLHEYYRAKTKFRLTN
ncbi:hypothetical protein GCK32_002801 [Trichostrongylus colubriformis]|uniref:SH2 domain-containing protein n=1 Tax=Trichostrongylus colubriformis TaxID=6319 RepID=A0AAN8FPW0_TRICO